MAPVIRAELFFLSPRLKKRPYTAIMTSDTNIVNDGHDVEITDLRSFSTDELKKFHIDTSGVQWVKHESKLKGDDLFDEKRIVDEYYPEIDALLKKELGASRTFFFDYTLRRGFSDGDTAPDAPGNRRPYMRTHVDQTPKAGMERVFLHMGDEAEKLSKGRCQIVNIWRAVRGPVSDFPLAACDYRSMRPESDLQEVDIIYPNRKGETYAVRHGDYQKWYYVSNQMPDDVLLLKCWESGVVPGRALAGPHSAFRNPFATGAEPPRKSIEVRALVFYD